MKKVFRIILCSCALFALVGCINDKTSSESSKTIEPSSSSVSILPSSSQESSSEISSVEPSSSIPSSSVAPSSSTPTEIRYRVVFQNYDGTILQEIDVLEGSKAEYSGETPTKEEDDEFTYEFQGWDKEEELNAVKSDVTTKAVYKSVGKEGWGSIIWF